MYLTNLEWTVKSLVSQIIVTNLIEWRWIRYIRQIFKTVRQRFVGSSRRVPAVISTMTIIPEEVLFEAILQRVLVWYQIITHVDGIRKICC